MKKCIKIRHFAGGTALALVTAVTLSMVPAVPAYNHGIALEAHAAESVITLTKDHFVISGDTITGFSVTGEAIFAGISNNSDETLTLEFPSDSEITKIGDNAFKGYDYLSSRNSRKNKINLRFPGNIQEIGKSAFENDDLITSVTFENGLKKIDTRAFKATHLSMELVLPETVTEIGEKSFSNTLMPKVTIPGSIKTIPKEAFWTDGNSISNLTTVVLNEGLETISERAFSNNSITKIYKSSNSPESTEWSEFPDSLTRLDAYAFSHNKLVKVKLPDHIKMLNSDIFANNEITDFDFGTFEDIPLPVSDPDPSKDEHNTGTEGKGYGARRWENDLHYVGKMIPMGILAHNHLTSITFPKDIWAIGSYAFEG